MTGYAYTPGGRLASVSDAAGNVWLYTYDLLGRRVGADDPDKGVTSTTYDAAGWVTTATDARGVTLA